MGNRYYENRVVYENSTGRYINVNKRKHYLPKGARTTAKKITSRNRFGAFDLDSLPVELQDEVINKMTPLEKSRLRGSGKRPGSMELDRLRPGPEGNSRLELELTEAATNYANNIILQAFGYVTSNQMVPRYNAFIAANSPTPESLDPGRTYPRGIFEYAWQVARDLKRAFIRNPGLQAPPPENQEDPDRIDDLRQIYTDIFMAEPGDPNWHDIHGNLLLPDGLGNGAGLIQGAGQFRAILINDIKTLLVRGVIR